MSEGSYRFGYADLSAALACNSLGVSRAAGITTDDGLAVYVVALAGRPVSGAGSSEIAFLVHEVMVVDLIVELARALRDGGMPTERLDALMDRALGHVKAYPDDVEVGMLFEQCTGCRRPEPECICDRVGARL